MSRTIKDRPYISIAAEASRRGFTETPRWRGPGRRPGGALAAVMRDIELMNNEHEQHDRKVARAVQFSRVQVVRVKGFSYENAGGEVKSYEDYDFLPSNLHTGGDARSILTEKNGEYKLLREDRFLGVIEL